MTTSAESGFTCQADIDAFEQVPFADRIFAGAIVFEGYIIDSQSAGVFYDIDGATWFNSGDLARQDADGYFWMTGRKKELIIRGGHNIDPKVIEEAMHMHPRIAMAAAIGRPDVKAGELPVLYYQLTTGADISAAELTQFAETHVPERAAMPKDYIRLDELPLTGIGKIHKVTLNMREVERAIRTEAEAKGAVISDLEVVQDSKRGIVAKLTLIAGQDEMVPALGNYTFTVDFIA